LVPREDVKGNLSVPISRATFESGLTAEQYLATLENNQERIRQNIDANEFTPEDIAFFEATPVSVAAIVEDWCTDVVHYLPVMIKLSQVTPSVTLRIFQRDKSDLIDGYLNQGLYKSIPVFVLYDAGWNELGHFIERPESHTKAMAQETLRFARENAHLEGVTRSYENMPDETRQAVRENSSRYRWETMASWNRIFIEEIKEIVRSGKPAVVSG
jgi:hypothetical protein